LPVYLLLFFLLATNAFEFKVRTHDDDVVYWYLISKAVS
jgi:hypothetical protein